MTADTLLLRQTAVFISAVIYWAGVMMNALRVRKQIGRAPDLKPKDKRERLLWAGWLLVIAGWIAQPVIVRPYKDTVLFSFIGFLYHPAGLFIGILLMFGGYIGTLWCYMAIGDSWRIGISRNEKTELIIHGPYKYIRHPIYLFQIIMLLGVTCLLPTLFSFSMNLFHFVFAFLKSSDEENHLMNIHRAGYMKYLSGTGRFFPRLRTKRI